MLDGIGVVVSILSAAIKVSGAWEDKGLGKEEVEALGALHKALVAGAGLVPPEAEPDRLDLEVDHLLIGVFGEALGGYTLVDDLRTLPDKARRFWAGEAAKPHDEVLPQMRTWGARLAARFRTEQRGLEDTLQARLSAAITAPSGPASGEAPLALPLYRALRRAVNDPTLGAPLVPDADWLSFERDVLYGWHRRISRREDLRAWLKLEKERDAERLWDLVVREQADWGDRHVFGNRRRGADDGGVRHVSLDEIYVEPELVLVRRKSTDTPDQGPALTTILRCLNHDPVVVRADFGMGKSLTARRLTRDLSRQWLESGGTGWLPLYVRCADDLGERRFRKERVIRPAMLRILRGAGLDISDDDVPDTERPGSRTLIVLDGLDEVELGSKDLDGLFQDIDRTCGAHRRVLTLSRPGALPPTLPDRFRLLDVQPLDTDRVARWLQGWREVMGEGPDLDGLEARGLAALAATPILLYMIAWTWGETTDGGDVGEVYERFLRSLAKGKFERDQDQHPVVARAARPLANNLRTKGHIQSSDPVDAMLWFLARAAWEARCLAAARPPRDLDNHDLVTLIREVAPSIEASDLDAVKLGVLLAMQIDPHGGTARVFFGHRSFAEYLCARFWEMTLVRGLRRQDEREIAALGRAPLVLLHYEEDRALSFLLGRLGQWDEPDQRALQGWTLKLLREAPTQGSFPSDHGWALRRSMLAVASQTEGWAGWDVSDEELPTLRALLTWSWVTGWPDRVIASGLRLPPKVRLDMLLAREAVLTSASLIGANLFGSNLSRADLSESDLHRGDLSGADLSGADLSGADLSGADLSGADLSGADLFSANLDRTNLSEADLSGAIMSRANLSESILSGAILFGAILNGARFHESATTRWSASTRWPEGFTPPKPPDAR